MCLYIYLSVQLEPAWESNFPGLVSMAVPKNSPYKPFLWAATLDLHERGQKDFLVSRFAVKSPHDCKEAASVPNPTNVTLGFEKIFTLFLLMGAGMMASLALLIMECCLYSGDQLFSARKRRWDPKRPLFSAMNGRGSKACESAQTRGEVMALIEGTKALQEKAAGLSRRTGAAGANVSREMDLLLLALEELLVVVADHPQDDHMRKHIR